MMGLFRFSAGQWFECWCLFLFLYFIGPPIMSVVRVDSSFLTAQQIHEPSTFRRRKCSICSSCFETVSLSCYKHHVYPVRSSWPLITLSALLYFEKVQTFYKTPLLSMTAYKEGWIPFPGFHMYKFKNHFDKIISFIVSWWKEWWTPNLCCHFVKEGK